MRKLDRGKLIDLTKVHRYFVIDLDLNKGEFDLFSTVYIASEYKT